MYTTQIQTLYIPALSCADLWRAARCAGLSVVVCRAAPYPAVSRAGGARRSARPAVWRRVVGPRRGFHGRGERWPIHPPLAFTPGMAGASYVINVKLHSRGKFGANTGASPKVDGAASTQGVALVSNRRMKRPLGWVLICLLCLRSFVIRPWVRRPEGGGMPAARGYDRAGRWCLVGINAARGVG